jgi:zinc transport system substrate-binding protein
VGPEGLSSVPMRVLPMLLLLLPVIGCDRTDADAGPDRGGAQVVAVTLHPLASLADHLGGGAVEVRTLLPPGAHPDTYEATPRVAEALSDASLLIRVGGAADAWLGSGAPTETLVVTDGLTLLGAAGARAVSGTGNPHVWLDPILVRDSLLPRIAAALARVAPDSAEAIHRRAEAYADSLTALDREIRGMLDGIRTRRYVSSHPAWVYFAARYDLEEVGTLHPSPGTELGSRELARLVEASRSAGVGAVIAEPQLGEIGATALAEELDVPVVVADPIGGPTLEGRSDYLSLMRFNGRAFARALGADS